MARAAGIGHQDFEVVRQEEYFYTDKTGFIREWWENGYGRYDVMLEPKNPQDHAVIMEFKMQNRSKT